MTQGRGTRSRVCISDCSERERERERLRKRERAKVRERERERGKETITWDNSAVLSSADRPVSELKVTLPHSLPIVARPLCAAVFPCWRDVTNRRRHVPRKRFVHAPTRFRFTIANKRQFTRFARFHFYASLPNSANAILPPKGLPISPLFLFGFLPLLIIRTDERIVTNRTHVFL